MVALRINEQEFDIETAQKMIDAGILGAGQKHDTSSTTPGATPPHGPFPGNNNQFGPFSAAGVQQGMWDTTPHVRSIGNIIPMYKSVVFDQLIEMATGVTAGSGNNVTGACAVGPKPGQLKGFQQSARFGIIHASTKIFDVTQAGMRRTLADIDRQIYNQSRAMNRWIPDFAGSQFDGYVNSVMRAELRALGIELERNVSQVHFTGVQGTEDNTYRGVARQWNGLDRLIRNDWTDVDGNAVAAAAAAVTSFNTNVDGTDGDGRSIVEALIDTYFGQIDYVQTRLGISPVYVLVMRPELFRALAQQWSCTYSVTRCTSTEAGQPLNRDAVSVRNEYESMLAGQYLPMEGTNVPVVFDDAIPRETLGNNYYKSDIYGVMLSGNGIPTLYAEFFDMDNPEALEIVNVNGMIDDTRTENGGLYRVFKYVTGGCVELDYYARPRLITTAPFAHFRVDDVYHRVYYRSTDATPGMSYYRDGGVTHRL